MVFPHNTGPNYPLSKPHYPRENSLKIITNNKEKGKKGAIVDMFSVTKIELIIEQFLKISIKKTFKAKEITL